MNSSSRMMFLLINSSYAANFCRSVGTIGDYAFYKKDTDTPLTLKDLTFPGLYEN